MNANCYDFNLDHDTIPDPALQAQIEALDARLREKFGMTPDQTAAGVLDLKTQWLAMIHPDRGEYAASIPKIGILLAYFELHREAALELDDETRHQLGLMVKASSNEMATHFSRALGLKKIQEVINRFGFHDPARGGGLWMGKHYGVEGERYGDPLGDNSHAATIRQLLRFFLHLEQGKLISPKASETMRAIFASPEIPHDEIKFVKGLAGRDLEIIRKWGSWETWLHDCAVVKAAGKHYILAALIHHEKGDDYLEEFAAAVDELLTPHTAKERKAPLLG
jgi:beta-lactamase class A